jgi:subtilisin family serine protease
MNKNKFWMVLLILGLCPFFLVSQKATGIEVLGPDDVAASEPAGPDFIDFRLRQLMRVRQQLGEEAALDFARRFAIPYTPETGVRVQVVAHKPGRMELPEGTMVSATDWALNRLGEQVEILGGQVLHRYGFNMACRVPLDRILTLAPYASTIHLPFPLHRRVVTEGVDKMGVGPLQNLTPFRAEGVHVCIFDIGFENHEQLLGTELPSDFQVYTVRDDGVRDDGVHGTACAEIVHDVAPDARLSGLASMYVTDIFPAYDWFVENDVDVISASIGHYYSPGDGTGYEDEVAKALKTRNIVYVTSAGNEGNDHYAATFNDPDGDGWHNFSGQDEILSFYVPAYTPVQNILRWDDWGTWNPDTLQWAGATQDYDLYLFIQTPSTGEWVRYDEFSSLNRQPGYKMPMETITGVYAPYGANWGLGIRKHQASRNPFFNLFVLVHTTMEYQTPAGSIGIPADSPNIVAVGASDVMTDELHNYSSRGPTLDGRVKPDVTAPSGVSCSSQTYGPRGFYGTSASCPHMAGLIALFRSKTPFLPDQIVQTIFNRVLDLGLPGFDNLFGRGRIRAKGD